MQLRRMPRSFALVVRLTPPPLSPVARTRLQALTVWQQTGNWRFAAQVFWLSSATLFRWRRWYVAADLSRLESRSRWTHHVRPATTVRRLRNLRLQYSRWGREKLRMLFRREGIMLSAKTIDRVLARLRATGQLVEPPRQAISASRRQRARPYAVRNPGTMALPLLAISCKSIHSMCGPGRASCSSNSRPARSCPTGTGWRPIAAPPVCRPRTFSPPCNGGCPSPFGPFKSLGAVSLPPLNRPASSRAFASSSSHRPHHALGYLSPAELLAHHAAHRPPSHMS
jgi:hypothetical protein